MTEHATRIYAVSVDLRGIFDSPACCAGASISVGSESRLVHGNGAHHDR